MLIIVQDKSGISRGDRHLGLIFTERATKKATHPDGLML